MIDDHASSSMKSLETYKALSNVLYMTAFGSLGSDSESEWEDDPDFVHGEFCKHKEMFIKFVNQYAVTQKNYRNRNFFSGKQSVSKF